MMRLSLRDHSQSGCFVCFVLSHGKSNEVYGIDNMPVAIEEILSVFKANQCPTLAGKPKLLFLQACQGERSMRYVTVETDVLPYGTNNKRVNV